jgi:hypothetical protein
MPYKVVEEIWPISSDDKQRKSLSSSERSLFSGGGSSIAYEYAKQLASKFAVHGFHEDAESAYWWGRNEGDFAIHRYVIKPAAPLERR